MNTNLDELLDKIRHGEPIDTDLIPGYISTPIIPDEVFTIVTKTNGEEFKRYLEADKWIAWLNQVADKNIDPEADITEKVIVGSSFYKQCGLSIREIIRKEENGMSGTIWLNNGKPYAVSLIGDKIQEAKDALARAQQHAVEPVSRDLFVNDDRYDDEQQRTIEEIVKGSNR